MKTNYRNAIAGALICAVFFLLGVYAEFLWIERARFLEAKNAFEDFYAQQKAWPHQQEQERQEKLAIHEKEVTDEMLQLDYWVIGHPELRQAEVHENTWWKESADDPELSRWWQENTQ